MLSQRLGAWICFASQAKAADTPAHCSCSQAPISLKSHPQTDFLASPGTFLVTADSPVIPRLTLVTTTGPDCDLLVGIPGLTWFCFITMDLLSVLGYGLNMLILHSPAHLAQLQWDTGLAGKERHLELTQFLPLVPLHLTLFSVQAPNCLSQLQKNDIAEAVAWTRKIVPLTCLSIPS